MSNHIPKFNILGFDVNGGRSFALSQLEKESDALYQVSEHVFPDKNKPVLEDYIYDEIGGDPTVQNIQKRASNILRKMEFSDDLFLWEKSYQIRKDQYDFKYFMNILDKLDYVRIDSYIGHQRKSYVFRTRDRASTDSHTITVGYNFIPSQAAVIVNGSDPKVVSIIKDSLKELIDYLPEVETAKDQEDLWRTLNK